MTPSITKEEADKLVEAAREAVKAAYAPYSKFAVGAALLDFSGNIFTGCNIENISYGLTNCAERTAVYKAVAAGIRKFKAIAIYADKPDYCPPCGACRQVIAEFGDDILVIQANRNGEYKINTIDELIPGGFKAEIMKGDTNE